MLALGLTLAFSLAATTSSLPGARLGEAGVASTYAEAACDGDEGGECAPEPGDALPWSAAAPPVVLDCNDPRLALFMQEMIGSCDMPRLSPLAPRPSAVANAGASRAVDEAGPSDAVPLCGSVRAYDDQPSALLDGGLAAIVAPRAAALRERPADEPEPPPRTRLDRPPRHLP